MLNFSMVQHCRQHGSLRQYKNVKVAIANCDTGGHTDSMDLNAGDTIVQNQKKNHPLGWTFVDESKAKTGASTIQQQINDTFSSVAADSIAKIIQKSAGDLTGKIDNTNPSLMQALTDIRKNLADYQKALESFQNTVKESTDSLSRTGSTLAIVDKNPENIISDLKALQSSNTYQHLISLEGINSDSISVFILSGFNQLQKQPISAAGFSLS